MIFLIFSILIVLGLFTALFFFLKHVRRKDFLENLKLKLFLVRLPRQSREGKDLKQEILISEQLFASLAALKRPFVLEVAVPYVGEAIHFYVAVPEKFEAVLPREIQSLWNEAQVEPIDDYNIFNYSGESRAFSVRLKERFVLPIRTYQELSADTFMPFLGGLTKINEVGEGGALQFIVRPAPAKSRKSVQGALRVLKKGWKLKEMLGHPLAISVSDVGEAISPKDKKKEPQEKIVDEVAVKALEMKLSKPLFEVNVRGVSSAPSGAQADSILEGLSAGFSQFAAPERNEFKIVRPRLFANLIYQFSFREFNKDQAMILNIEELASLFHFPTPFTEIPKIKSVKAKEAPPPSDLPKEGVLVGESIYR